LNSLLIECIDSFLFENVYFGFDFATTRPRRSAPLNISFQFPLTFPPFLSSHPIENQGLDMKKSLLSLFTLESSVKVCDVDAGLPFGRFETLSLSKC